MRIIFYSSYVEFCIKLIEYIKMNSLEEYFKIVNIDDLSDKETKELGLSIIPTLIDTDIDTTFEGTKAWEYIKNQKYFNHPTNNIENTKNGIPKPLIEEDTKANFGKSGSGFLYVDQEVEKKYVDKEDKHNFDKVFEIKENIIKPINKSNNKSIINSQIKTLIKPIVQPIKPIVQPIKPIVQPIKPIVQPIKPVVQPIKPVVQPIKPVVQNSNTIIKEENVIKHKSIDDKKLLALMKLRKV